MDFLARVPLAISAKTTEELAKKFASIQAQEGARLAIVSIYYDTDRSMHILWYYPAQGSFGPAL